MVPSITLDLEVGDFWRRREVFPSFIGNARIRLDIAQQKGPRDQVWNQLEKIIGYAQMNDPRCHPTIISLELG